MKISIHRDRNVSDTQSHTAAFVGSYYERVYLGRGLQSHEERIKVLMKHLALIKNEFYILQKEYNVSFILMHFYTFDLAVDQKICCKRITKSR